MATHFYGKWHVGQRSPANMPARRGFDQSLVFLTGAENHFHTARGRPALRRQATRPLRSPRARPGKLLVVVKGGDPW
jgi:hypothetical protein